jgi:hypothetical protein
MTPRARGLNMVSPRPYISVRHELGQKPRDPGLPWRLAQGVGRGGGAHASPPAPPLERSETSRLLRSGGIRAKGPRHAKHSKWDSMEIGGGAQAAGCRRPGFAATAARSAWDAIHETTFTVYICTAGECDRRIWRKRTNQHRRWRSQHTNTPGRFWNYGGQRQRRRRFRQRRQLWSRQI